MFEPYVEPCVKFRQGEVIGEPVMVVGVAPSRKESGGLGG